MVSVTREDVCRSVDVCSRLTFVVLSPFRDRVAVGGRPGDRLPVTLVCAGVLHQALPVVSAPASVP